MIMRMMIKIKITNILITRDIIIIIIIILLDRKEALEEVGLILSVYCCFPWEKEGKGGSEWVVAFSQTLFSFASSQTLFLFFLFPFSNTFSFASSQSIVIISRFIMASQSRQSLHWGRQGHLGLLLHYYGNQSSIHLTTWKKMNLIDDDDNTFQHYHWRNKLAKLRRHASRVHFAKKNFG